MQEWLTVNNRIIQAPPEFHALRHENFMRERRRQEAKRESRVGTTTLACGCVLAHEPHNHYRTVTVHFCPTHWKERKRNV